MNQLCGPLQDCLSLMEVGEYSQVIFLHSLPSFSNGESAEKNANRGEKRKSNTSTTTTWALSVSVWNVYVLYFLLATCWILAQ